MKTIYKILFFVLALTLSACQKNDATMDYGFPKVYIPQATITGLDNSYPIPSGPFYQNSVYTSRYDNDSGQLQICLGVIRSGYIADQKAFSVKLRVSADQTAAKLAEYAEAGTPAAELPLSMCSIPARISVERGSNGGTCYVSVDMKALSQQRSSIFDGTKYKLLVLGLEISDPSEYELAESNTSVVIVLDLNSEHWDSVAADKPESEVRILFPTT